MKLILVILVLASCNISLANSFCDCDKNLFACRKFCHFKKALETCGTRVASRRKRHFRPREPILRRRSRVYNGRKISIMKAPWTVKLRPTGLGEFCTGSLISPSVVITAAHCVYRDSNPKHWSVSAGHGSSSWFFSRNEPGFQQRSVERILYNSSKFDSRTLKKDLALLVLSQPFNITPFVRTICLPSPGYRAKCLASGWGETEIGQFSQTIEAAWLPIVPRRQCRKAYKATIFDDNICAGGNGQDTCRGDSGGPLACFKNGRFELSGVLSWGSSQCGQIGKPAVYTSVINDLLSIKATINYFK